MQTKSLKKIVIILAVIIGIGIVYQVFTRFSSPYQTVVAHNASLANTVKVQGVFYKDEQVIDANAQGVVHYVYSNGAKVASNSQIAQVYKSGNDVMATEQIKKTEKKLQKLNEAKNQANSQNADITVVQKEIYNTYQNILTLINQDRLMNLENKKDDLTFLMNEKQIMMKKDENIDQAKADMENKLNELKGSISTQPQTINSSISGYFVDSVDGLEQTCTLDNATNLTKAKLKDQISEQSTTEAPNSIGKVIENPKLLFETVVESKSMVNVKVGKECKLNFSDLGAEVKATLTRLDINKDESDGLAEFTIDNIDEKIVSARNEKCEIILDENEGLKVPKTAIREDEEGQAGVYVSNNVSMKFKKIDIIFENEDYILSEIYPKDSSYLKAYDSVIVQGKDLYDNKNVK